MSLLYADGLGPNQHWSLVHPPRTPSTQAKDKPLTPKSSKPLSTRIYFYLHGSVPANSVAKPPCADTPKRRRMARRGHIRRYADMTVGGLGWLTPIRAYTGTPLADMPVRGKNTPIRPENTPIRRSRSKHADTPIRRSRRQIRRYADLGRKDGTVYWCFGDGAWD